MAKRLEQIQNWPERAQAAKWCAVTLAENCGVTLRQLQREFRQQFARTLQDWLDEQRLQAAPSMLRAGMQVKLVGAELGYKQTSHFCRQFKIYHQMTPMQFVALEGASLGKMPPKSTAKVPTRAGAKLPAPGLAQPGDPFRLPTGWRCSIFPQVRTNICPHTPWLPCAKLSGRSCRANVAHR